MENLKSVLEAEQTASIQADIESIISTRRQLFHFVPSENNLIITFSLEDGNRVQVPIHDPYKVRTLIREVRDYLEERELVSERRLKSLF